MSLVEQLQLAFPFSRRELDVLIHTAPRRYKVHTIEKRNGRGTRVIAQPTAELKLVQKWLIQNVFKDLPVHRAAMAYRRGVGIKDHAQLHASGRYLLKLDFENFFPSIRAEDFRIHLSRFMSLSLPDQVAATRLLFRADPDTQQLILSIGAPSSPFISNTVMFSFDAAVMECCERLDIRYSRYADDLALSTNRPFILNELKAQLLAITRNLEYPHLRLNESKTVFTSKKYQRQLTGLILSNSGHASLGRDRKRQIRAMAHRFSQNALPPEDVAKLRGLVAFSASIDREFVLSIRRMLGEAAFLGLTHGRDGSL